MASSTHAQEAFDKIQHSLLIQTLIKVSIERAYPKRIRVIYDKPTANVMANNAKLKAFPIKSQTRRTPTVTTFIEHNIGDSSTAIIQEKKIKVIQIRMKKN